MESGVWCTSVGHRNERVLAAITGQMNVLMHSGFCYSNAILEAASKAILEVSDLDNGKCVFLCSGSEAVEISRQMARHLTGRKQSATLHDSYLGAYESITDRDENWCLVNWQQCKSCQKKEQCDPSCDVLEGIPKDISEFIFEPGSSSGFVRFPPKAFIQNIVKTVRKNGGQIIANEVTTGVGRTGRWFGYQHYGIDPDFIAVGKGIGNGYPVSVVCIHESMAAKLQDKPFHYSQSHQNDPLGAAVVHSVIQEIETNNLIAEAKRKGAAIRNRLASLVDNNIVLEVRGRGMMFAIEMANSKIADETYLSLIDRGFILGYRGTSLRIDPPLVITDGELENFFHAFESVVSRENMAL